MSLDKFQQAWKAETSRMKVTFDADLLSNEVQRSQQNFRSTIFWRDVREVGTSLVMIPVWFAMGIGSSLPWTWYLTVPAFLWVAGFILVDRKRHPQRPSDPGEPLLFYVNESVTQVEHQIWLLRNVFWWYLLPFCISAMSFFLHVAWKSSSTWWEFALVAGGFGLFLVVIYGWTYRLNQKAVRDQLQPRRQDLLKLVASLDGNGDAGDSGEITVLVSALADTDCSAGLCSNWAENWNLIIPSWREVAAIIVPTLIGAYFGLRYPIPDMGPVFFQSVVAAVIPFEIAFFTLMLRSHRRKKQRVLKESGISTANIGQDDPSVPKPRLLPKAPAIVILVMILLMSVLAFAAIFSCVAEMKSSRGTVTNHGYAKVAPFTGVRWENDRPIVRVQDSWMPVVSIDGIAINRIMKFANEQYGQKARKRFAEDLVEVLATMGHEPDWTVTLELKTQDGNVERQRIIMTEDNRDLVRQ